MQQPQAGLELSTKVPWWLFTVQLFPVKISIDGSAPIPGQWGSTLLPMTPGRHVVKVWWMAYWFIPVNRAELTIDVPVGQVAQLQYRPRWLIFMAGLLQQWGMRPMLNQGGGSLPAAQPAGWFPDPTQRHEVRYWNGGAWTDDVSDAGVATKDAMT